MGLWFIDLQQFVEMVEDSTKLSADDESVPCLNSTFKKRSHCL